MRKRRQKEQTLLFGGHTKDKYENRQQKTNEHL